MNNANEEGLGNDAKGKLHEILVAVHLLDSEIIGPILKFPSHFRSKKQKTPKLLHDELKNSITTEQYDHHYQKAKYAAESIKKHLILEKRGKIKDVHWTSQINDIKRLTGESDSNNPSDIVITHEDGCFSGISLKLKKVKTITTLANPGAKTLDENLGINFQKVKNREIKSPLLYYLNKTKTMSLEAIKEHVNLDKYDAKIHSETGQIISKTTGKQLIVGNSSILKSLRGIEARHPKLKLENRKTAQNGENAAAKEYFEVFKQKSQEEQVNALHNLIGNKPTKMKMYVSKTYGVRK